MSIFGSILSRNDRYNAFDRSHERKQSMRMGFLTPILLEEVVPGDKFRVNSEIMVRMAPMVAPLMHRVNVYTHFFFVPNRIIWDNFEKWYTGGKDGTHIEPYPTVKIDTLSATYFERGRLADYLGLPTTSAGIGVTQEADVSALPFRAYVKIWNDYYRDANLQDEAPITYGSTAPEAENPQLLGLRRRAWEKDYFTSGLPHTQAGQEIHLPVEFNYKDESEYYNQDGSAPLGTTSIDTTGSGGTPANKTSAAGISGRIENLETDASSVTIEELRRATRLQEYLERNARSGPRYREQILSRFNEWTKDSRMQRPEYLGGGKNPMSISETLSTIGEPATTPQGNMAGHGIGVGNTNQFKKKFVEHGWIVGIMSVLPSTAYQQGIPIEWQKTDRFQMYAPEFAHLGEQAIKTSEIYHDFHDATPPSQPEFAYQSRFAEYKFKNSSVHGEFRSRKTGETDLTKDYWHMARYFENPPLLNQSFIEANPTNRIFNVVDQDIDNLYCMIYNNVKALRKMPYHNIPRL